MNAHNNLAEELSKQRLRQLRDAIGAGPLLILTHDNPDPDALASGKALAVLVEVTWRIPARLCYSGLVARAENFAMLRILTPEWIADDTEIEIEEYSAIAMVDTQPGAGNNSLPEGIAPQIVIDHHHPVRGGMDVINYVDVRPEVGATVSIVYQYIQAAGVVPNPTLATAMFYGIQADTRGLSRGASSLDQRVYFELLPLLDHKKLIQVEQAGLPREYFRALSKGLQAAKLYDQVVVCYLGEMHRPDFMAEMADLLIRLNSIQAALCIGYHSGTMYLSLRTLSDEQDAGILIQKVVVKPGRAGGHGSMAGGQVPLAGVDANSIAQQIEDRFVKSIRGTGDAESLLKIE